MKLRTSTPNPKLTPWYPGDVKPVRIGVYRREYPNQKLPRYCLWDGARWHWCAATTQDAEGEGEYISANQNLRWRGLARNPMFNR